MAKKDKKEKKRKRHTDTQAMAKLVESNRGILIRM